MSERVGSERVGSERVGSERVGSEAPLLLVGATGLVGAAVIAGTIGRDDRHLAALSRREASLPRGARLEMLLADPADWPDAIARAHPPVVVVALGTTIKTVGGDRAAFRAVDHDLVLSVARAAKAAGTRQLILVSSVGADPAARNFYLSVKGETEVAVNKLGFARLDILRPGLLRGARNGPSRPAERVGQAIAPFIDHLLRGRWASFRSVHARDVAGAVWALVGASGRGRFVHYSPDIHRLSRAAN